MKSTRAAVWCLLLGLAGLGLAGYLAYLHLGLVRGELLGGAACAAAGSLFNCHAVTAGPWSELLGMPLALWGVIGYAVVLALALWALQSEEAAGSAMTLLFLLAAGFVLLDLVLLAVMALVIRFYCLFCLLTYAANLALLLVAARSLPCPVAELPGRVGAAMRRLLPGGGDRAAGFVWAVIALGAAGAVGVQLSTLFVARGTLEGARRQIREYVVRQQRVSISTAEDPAVGPSGAFLQISEFSDFFCPVCERASKLNTILFANHRDDARFAFKHFPLDNSCNDRVSRAVHPGACRVAAASECAHLQGKFWEFHDAIFAKGHTYNLADLEPDAARLGLDVPRFTACLESGQGMEAVKRDIAEAAKIPVTSTPTYVVNGLPMPGLLNPTLFKDLVAVLREAR
jgi:protein-disulfide isomerase/uncharacterized membrane protein